MRQIIRQLEQLGVKKRPCLEMRVKNKERQEKSCWKFFRWQRCRSKMLERGEGKKAEGKVSCLGQGIQKLIFVPVNSWNF